MKKKKETLFILIVFLIGLSIFLYPVIGNVANDVRNHWQISQYKEQITEKDKTRYDVMFDEAIEMNKKLPGLPTKYEEDDPFYQEYKKALCLDGGIMGALSIKKIDVNLAIRHGTSEDVLQSSVGYLEGSHLPTGMVGNSTVLTGHTGLPSADLLSDLSKLKIGDTFKVTILNRSFYYEVFEINVVLPYEVDSIKPRPDIDMVTLLTCTPYGINSHRLLVHGKQIKVDDDVVEEYESEESIFTTTRFMLLISIPVILNLLILIIIVPKRIKKDKENKARKKVEKFMQNQRQNNKD